MDPNKPLFTISVAASLLKLHPRTLMLYEKAGFAKPHRTATKRRLFSIADLDTLQFIKYLTHQEGLNIQGAKKIIEAISLGESQGLQMKKRLFPGFEPKKLI